MKHNGSNTISDGMNECVWAFNGIRYEGKTGFPWANEFGISERNEYLRNVMITVRITRSSVVNKRLAVKIYLY